MQNQTPDHRTESEDSASCTIVTIDPSSIGSIDNSGSNGIKIRRGHLETCLNSYYYAGVSPFRVDSNRDLRSSLVNKVLMLQ